MLTDHFPAPKGVPYKFALPVESIVVDPNDEEEGKEGEFER